jgi:hypothetical protein
MPPPPPGGAAGAYYAYPEAAYGSLPDYAYRKGTLIPPGYHLEDRPRQGFVTAGYLVTGIPYAIGLMAAASAQFENQSGWLVVPFLGPWMTIGRRDYACIGKDDADRDSADCAGDAVIAPLIVDGILQSVGGMFLAIGYLVTKQYVVKDELAFIILPSRVGSGYGLTLIR